MINNWGTNKCKQHIKYELGKVNRSVHIDSNTPPQQDTSNKPEMWREKSGCSKALVRMSVVFLEEASHSMEKVPNSMWLWQKWKWKSMCLVWWLFEASLESMMVPALLMYNQIRSGRGMLSEWKNVHSQRPSWNAAAMAMYSASVLESAEYTASSIRGISCPHGKTNSSQWSKCDPQGTLPSQCHWSHASLQF